MIVFLVAVLGLLFLAVAFVGAAEIIRALKETYEEEGRK